MQSINKNYDSGQDSVLFFQGKEYKLKTLKSFERDRTFPEEKLILEKINHDSPISNEIERFLQNYQS